MNEMSMGPLESPVLRGQSVLIVSASQYLIQTVTELLRDIGLAAVSCASLASATRPEVHRARKGMFAGIIVDVDSSGGIGASFDRLRNIREYVSELPVILVSAEVKRDDLTRERLPICDVTLRKPVSEASLLVGIRTAQFNCIVWRKRVSRRDITSHAMSAQSLPAPEPATT